MELHGGCLEYVMNIIVLPPTKDILSLIILSRPRMRKTITTISF
jgi:hypothetical protein